MAFFRALIHSALVAAFICSLLAASQFAQGQTVSPDQQEQSAQHETQAANTSSVSVNDEEFPKEWPLARNILCYEQFLDWVGKEDTRIQQETQAGKQQIAPRIDYASAIGISNDKEQAMLAILLNAYRKSEENRKRYQQAQEQLLNEHWDSSQYSILTHEVSVQYAAMLKANRVILDGTYIKLKEILGQEDFKKLDKYLDREFATAYPASLRAAQGAVARKPAITPFPTDVRYEFFIRHVGDENARVHRDIQAGYGNMRGRDYRLAAHIPEVEEQPLLTIVLEGYEQLNENDRQTHEVIQEIQEKYGGTVPPPQVPPDLQALVTERKGIIGETMARLKQELGPEYFDDLDAWISHHWAGAEVYTPPAPADNPTPVQMPDVQP